MLLHRKRYPLSESCRKAQASHRRAHAEVRPEVASHIGFPFTPSRHNLAATIDPHNSGVLIVQLEGGTAAEQARDSGGVMLGADDITQRLDRQDEGCIVM
jgi:hypothetical protein